MSPRKRPPVADPSPPPARRSAADLTGLVNLSEVVARHAAVAPADAALIEVGPAGETARVGYAELEQRIRRAAAVLGGHGLVAGDRVALRGANSIDWVVAYLGCLRAGGVALPVNPHSTPAEQQRLLDHGTPRLRLADDTDLTADAADAADGWRSLALPGATDTPDTALVESPRDAEALALLMTTAGSTGTPKSVMLTHRALLAHCEQSARTSPAGADSVALAMLPFFHIYGLNGVLGLGLYLGACLVLVDGHLDDLAGVVERQQISELPVTPSVLYRLLAADDPARRLASVEHVISGGAPLANALREEFRRVTGLRPEQGYGMTEAGPGIASTGQRPHPDAATTSGPATGTATAADDADLIGGFVGPPLPGVEVSVGDGTRPGETGEIRIRGANLFSGYWPTGAGGPDPDGWFATGDVGFRTAQGLHLVDRLGDLIIVSGFNVYPSEIEEVLREFDQVSDAAVIGRPDEHTGERVVAFVTGGRSRPSPAGLRAHCAARLARYKLPAEIYVLGKLPVTTTGKTRKARLRDLLDASDA